MGTRCGRRSGGPAAGRADMSNLAPTQTATLAATLRMCAGPDDGTPEGPLKNADSRLNQHNGRRVPE